MNGINKLINFLALTAFGFVLDLWRAFVATKLYTWFVLLLFPMLPTISVVAMLGLILFVATVRGFTSAKPADEDTTDAMVRTYLVATIMPTIMLGLGWVTKTLL